ncbi:RagB/SusD family nutrient uptake outer membrane protein [Thalassobellus citreus]|uniref:RagB/SusD family nutrient uptake outer membrane protein n=1 Tax=Thalassobellus citreus TaxID=3367752 RepID=UPI003798D743
MKKHISINKMIVASILLISSFLNSCDNYLEPDPSTASLTSENVFLSDATSNSAISGMYATIMNSNEVSSMLNGGLGVMTGLSADEIHDFNTTYQDYETNSINYSDFGPVYYHWLEAYKSIYNCNAAIIGLTDNEFVTPSVRDNLLGEVYFMRALNYFYLTNLYGAVPLITNTDPAENKDKSRTSSDEIYNLIVSDLDLAIPLLAENYISAERTRPNKYTAKALRARVALYLGDNVTAINESTDVINNAATYTLSPIESVFKNTSQETIWQLASVSWKPNALDAHFYNPNGRPSYTITDDLLNSFEINDKRKTNWIAQYTYNSEIYNYPFKYTQTFQRPITEYNVVFRLAEQYLIRAEAKAATDIPGAVSDLDEIRKRADLLPYSGTLSKTAVLDAIAQERRVELFSEWGHRWFDLKRTSKIDAVLGAFKDNWKSSAQLWPIPQKEIDANQNLNPNNEGYN